MKGVQGVKNNRKCILCGKEYKYCGNCAEDSRLEPWHNIYHDNNCRVIFNTATDYCAGLLTKEQAMEIFNNCDLSDKASFNASVLKVLDELYPNEEVKEAIVVEEVAKTEDLVTEKPVSATSYASNAKQSYSQNNYKHKNKKRK